MDARTRKRSSWLSGSGQVPWYSWGFCVAMTMNGLLSALENDIAITVVVFNNSALGWSLHSRGPFAAEFQDFNYAAIAMAMGCNGHRVNTPEELGPALQAAMGSRLPTVIDVRTSLASSYIDLTSPLAKG